MPLYYNTYTDDLGWIYNVIEMYLLFLLNDEPDQNNLGKSMVSNVTLLAT